MQKALMAQSAVTTILSALFFLVPSGVLAQSAALLPVVFRVEVGDLSCKDSLGTASVLFVTEPKEGGYFDIIGAPITQNKITLDRRVALQSGKYTWKGIANEKYREAPPSIGEFTIPECGASSSAVSPIKRQTTPLVVKKETESPGVIENMADANKETIASSSSDVTNEGDAASGGEQSKTYKWIIYLLVVLGIAAGFFAWKNPAQNTNR
jgi:hypothetical protein